MLKSGNIWMRLNWSFSPPKTIKSWSEKSKNTSSCFLKNDMLNIHWFLRAGCRCPIQILESNIKNTLLNQFKLILTESNQSPGQRWVNRADKNECCLSPRLLFRYGGRPTTAPVGGHRGQEKVQQPEAGGCTHASDEMVRRHFLLLILVNFRILQKTTQMTFFIFIFFCCVSSLKFLKSDQHGAF